MSAITPESCSPLGSRARKRPEGKLRAAPPPLLARPLHRLGGPLHRGRNFAPSLAEVRVASAATPKVASLGGAGAEATEAFAAPLRLVGQRPSTAFCGSPSLKGGGTCR